MGHIIAAIICKWNIEKIVLLPFGGLIVFKECLNKSIYEELFIVLLGPLFQLIHLLFINDPNFRNLSINLLLFNLIPIVPLDGSKMLNIFLNLVLPFKKSHLISIIISFITLIIVLKFNYSLFLIIILTFIFVQIIKEYNKHEYIFNKFLLERYLYNFNFKRIKKISNYKNMYKGKKHLILINGKYCSETLFLSKMFDK